MYRRFFLLIVFILDFSCCFFASAQESDSLKIIDYSAPREYTIDTVLVEGTHFLDKRVLANMSGFSAGSKITLPGDDVSKLVRKYWDHGLV